jgi:acetyl-CoA carboxylase biotin carboxyl carrier protein
MPHSRDLTKGAELDIKEIKAIIDLMKKNDLSVFKMESEGFKLTLKKGSDFQPVLGYQPMSMPVQTGPAASAAPAPEPKGDKEIVSPMVGTFYRAPSPDSPAYVEVGDTVTADTVVCIIEAMKVMNEIKAEVSGTITEIVAENGKPVQFGQPLFRVK